jgi:hypothetical protein
MSRATGTLNRKTLERREYEGRIAKRQIADARLNQVKLAKEILSQFMHQLSESAPADFPR